MDVLSLQPDTLRKLSDTDFRLAAAQMIELQQRDRQENALLFYRPVSPQAAKIHDSTARVTAVFGGNGSSKTETSIVELLILCTGLIPFSLQDNENVRKKLRGPVNCRIVCESLTTVLHPIILPKLQWFKWTGIDQPGGDRGHWGWIPRTSLIGGSWEKSWSEKLRRLRILYRDPNNPEKVIGESTLQCMSVDQDATDFASGDFHLVLHDEPPNLAIWRENEARTMRVNGRMLLAMTWSDDPAINQDWIFDEIYERANKGSKNIDLFQLYTTDNPTLDQDAIAAQAENWPDEVKRVRILGEPIRFSNRIHPLFTDLHQWWCFKCITKIIPQGDHCATCGSENIQPFCHVKDFDPQRWPTVFLLDPHPRKPHMFSWVQIDPQDDLWQVAEGEVDGDPTDVYNYVREIEGDLGLYVAQRLIDPNMGRSPASTKRGVTWQDEISGAGLYCDLADDSDVGRARLNEYMRPDPATYKPRFHVRTTCKNTIHQIKRYVWADHKRSLEKSQKQQPKDKYDDYPTLLKYLMNSDPTFGFLREGPRVIHTRGSRANQASTRFSARH